MEFTSGQLLFDCLTCKIAQRTVLLLHIASQPSVQGLGHVFDLESAHKVLVACYKHPREEQSGYFSSSH